MTIMDIQFLILFAPTLALLVYAVREGWKSDKQNEQGE